MKPRSYRIPQIIRAAFIGLEVLVLGLAAIFYITGYSWIVSSFGVGYIVVVLSLLAVLLLASIAMIFFDRRLAITGFVAFVLGVLAGIERPVLMDSSKGKTSYSMPNKSWCTNRPRLGSFITTSILSRRWAHI